jgi:hypothetical protein
MRHRRHARPLLTVTVLAAVLSLAVAGLARAATPVLVSGASPYASCTIGGPGTLYVNAEVEPFVAVNPANSGNLIGAWQQDRWSNGGAHGLVAGFSLDGGATWSETTLPFSACAPGGLNYERASDPWVSIGPDGTAYAVSISFNQSNNNNAVAAATSSDGGKTWTNLKTLITDGPSLQFFNDKESVTANPKKAGEAYAVWDRLELPNDNPDANLHTQAFQGPTYFSKTTNGGKSWSSPKQIVSFGSSRKQTIGNQILVDPRHPRTLYNFFDLITPPFGVTAYKVAFVKSTDDGATWTTPQIIADLRTVSVTDPNTGEAVRTGDINPEAAIDPATGRLYVAWQDSRFSGGDHDEVALSTSSDGGANWSAPKRVSTPTGRPAFTPSVHVNSAGDVGITYYDFRNLAAGDTATLPTDYWLKTSADHGATFGNDSHITGPFDMKTAPNALGFFVGDYEGLDARGSSFVPFFAAANSGNTANRTDVFATTVP